MSGKVIKFPNTEARLKDLEEEYLSLYEGLVMLEEELRKQRDLLLKLTSVLRDAASSSQET